eukprot:gene1142-1481_t
MTPGITSLPEVQRSEEGQAGMRAAGRLAARALQLAGSLVQPGVTTDDLDAAVHQYCIDHGAYPSPLLYHGYPKSICTSVNEAPAKEDEGGARSMAARCPGHSLRFAQPAILPTPPVAEIVYTSAT